MTEKVKLNEITDIYLGVTHTPEYVLDGVPFLSVKDISGGKICFDECKFISQKEYNSLSEGAKPKVGDMLFCRVGTIGKPIIIPEGTPLFGSFVSLGYLRNKAKDRCNLNYLRYWMYSNSFWKQVNKNVKGASQVNLNTGWLSNFEITLPDFSEQTYIVSILDKCKLIIERREEELKKFDNLIKARFVEMFGSIYNNEYGYNIKTLQDVCEPIKDGTHQTPIYTENIEKGFKFLSSKDVVSGKIDWSKVKYIPKELHEELYSRIKPQRGDLLLAKNGTTGVAAIVETDEVFDIYVSLAILRPVDINSVYLWGAVNSMETKRQFDVALKGIGVPNLHLGEIKKTKIVVPPIQIQAEFEQFVYQVNKSKVEVQKALDKAKLLFDSLMQKYFG